MPRQRVLFVDDDPLVIQGLQRVLRPMRGEWEMVFLESAAQALLAMDENPFEVIISDMRMPDMNGAQLLRKVMEKYPSTVRIVLSGDADHDLVVQCVGVAHQYISKPCEPGQIAALVRNACLLAHNLLDEDVKRVIGSIDCLPTLPDVYEELKAALRRDDASPQKLGDIILKDTGMTAKVLNLVNSAFFGLRRSITTPKDAVAYLGIEVVQTLVLVTGIFDKSHALHTRHFSMADLWHHTTLVAAGAKAICEAEGLDRTAQDEAFVGGILHDIGILILASNFPRNYDEAVEWAIAEKASITRAEERVFGISHAEVGAYLLGIWGLPASVLEIVALHHSPDLIPNTGFGTVLAVHAADALSADKAVHPYFVTNQLREETLLRLGLGDRREPWTRILAEERSRQ